MKACRLDDDRNHPGWDWAAAEQVNDGSLTAQKGGDRIKEEERAMKRCEATRLIVKSTRDRRSQRGVSTSCAIF